MHLDILPNGRLHLTGGSARGVPGARFLARTGGWTIIPCRAARTRLEQMGVVMTDAARAVMCPEVVPAPPKPFPRLAETLPAYDHQRRGREFMYRLRHAAIFAEPGTGKTRVLIDVYRARLAMHEVDSVIIACPVSVRRTWVDQFRLWAGVEAELLDNARDPIGSVVVVGIESLSAGRAAERLAGFIHRHRRTMIVVDEAHLIKNSRAIRTRKLVELGRSCAYRYIATGTPVAKSLVDLYAQFDFLDPDIIGYPDVRTFEQRYCRFGGFEQREIIGYKNEQELFNAIEPYVFRATKDECLDLPPKVYVRRQVTLPPAARAAYKTVKKTQMFGDKIYNGVLDTYLALHRICGGMLPDGTLYTSPKIAELLAVVEDSGGATCIVWCRYRSEVEAVAAALAPYGRVVQIHGDVGEAARHLAVQDMQEGRARFLVGTASSGGVGITITAATLVVYFSNDWSHVARVQSEDRAHRAGQTRTVTVVDIECADTVDESILVALAEKKDLSDYLAAQL